MSALSRRLAALRPLLAHPEFRLGAREMAALLPGYGAWGLVTGVAMIKGGWPLWLALAMSLSVFSAGAQLAALSLMATHTPPGIVVATAFCVNLRFVIFSAQWRFYLGHLPRRWRLFTGYFAADLNYVAFMRRYPEPKPADEPALAYFWGGVALNWSAWQVPSIAGILLADRVPTEWGLGFAGVLALLGLTYSLLSDRKSWISAGVAGCAAVASYALPLKLNIVVAIAAAVAMGLLLDHWMPDARKPEEAVK